MAPETRPLPKPPDCEARLDFRAMASAIEDPDGGCFVIRDLFGREQILAYREECARAFASGPRHHGKVLVPGETPDYVSPWIEDREGGSFVNHRLYQFFYNRHSPETDQIFRTVTQLRDRIEACWPENARYYRERELWPETIVTRYVPGVGSYPRHSDVPGGHTAPLLQCVLLLSEPGVDYEGGDLTYYTANGEPRCVQEDLGLRIGDCLFLDKRLEHEVAVTRRAPGSDVGRWSALVAAMAPAIPPPTVADRLAAHWRPLRARLRRGARRLLRR